MVMIFSETLIGNNTLKSLHWCTVYLDSHQAVVISNFTFVKFRNVAMVDIKRDFDMCNISSPLYRFPSYFLFGDSVNTNPGKPYEIWKINCLALMWYSIILSFYQCGSLIHILHVYAFSPPSPFPWGISLGMPPASERSRYNVTTSLTGWVHT